MFLNIGKHSFYYTYAKFSSAFIKRLDKEQSDEAKITLKKLMEQSKTQLTLSLRQSNSDLNIETNFPIYNLLQEFETGKTLI